jgi:hypothetical protein
LHHWVALIRGHAAQHEKEAVGPKADGFSGKAFLKRKGLLGIVWSDLRKAAQIAKKLSVGEVTADKGLIQM